MRGRARPAARMRGPVPVFAAAVSEHSLLLCQSARHLPLPGVNQPWDERADEWALSTGEGLPAERGRGRREIRLSRLPGERYQT